MGSSPTPADGDIANWALAHHGDLDVRPGMLDFAVNVADATPPWLTEILRSRIDDLAHYPRASELSAARDSIARAHHRESNNVLLLSGAAEGFALIAASGRRHAALITPSFTEPERVLRERGVAVTRVTLPPPWRIADAVIADDVDLVVVGNPTNPTSVLHPRDDIAALARPGRLVVVDEAFADITLHGDQHEPQSLARYPHAGIVVIRSITKTFALAGLRAGYLLGSAADIAAINRGRAHWPVNTLAAQALQSTATDRGRVWAYEQAATIRRRREYAMNRLVSSGIGVCGDPQASFILVRVDNGIGVRAHLDAHNIAVRRCDTFDGLSGDYLRLAVRDESSTDALLAAWPDSL